MNKIEGNTELLLLPVMVSCHYQLQTRDNNNTVLT